MRTEPITRPLASPQKAPWQRRGPSHREQGGTEPSRPVPELNPARQGLHAPRRAVSAPGDTTTRGRTKTRGARTLYQIHRRTQRVLETRLSQMMRTHPTVSEKTSVSPAAVGAPPSPQLLRRRPQESSLAPPPSTLPCHRSISKPGCHSHGDPLRRDRLLSLTQGDALLVSARPQSAEPA